MAFFRQYIAPLFIFLIFLVALLAVTARAFLPSDMAQPAPIEAVDTPQQAAALPPSIFSCLIFPTYNTLDSF